MSQDLCFNHDFTDADAERLCHYAALLTHSHPQHRLYSCGWMTSQGVCRLPVSGPEFPDHLRTHHGIVGSDKTPVMCYWDGCFIEMKKESLIRHVNERHLEFKFACPNCSERFTRNYTMQNHVTRKHSGG